MKILLLALFGFALLGLVPAVAQTQPLTTQQLQQQYDQTIQNTSNQTQQGMNQLQLGQIQDQERRDQAYSAALPPAYQEPILPPQPLYIPPAPPPVPKTKS